MAFVTIAVAIVLINIIFGYIVTGPDESTRRRCMYSLYRIGVALVEYCNVHDTTLTPPTLQALVDEGIVDADWLRCSEFGPQFGYFGEFDLLSPRPPAILWCSSGHVTVVRGNPVKTTLVLGPRMRVFSYTSKYFKEELKVIELARSITESGDSQEDIDRLLGFCHFGSDSSIRLFAIWKLGGMRLKRFEETFLKLLDQDVEALIKQLNSEFYKERKSAERELEIRFEAAHALALTGNPAGGAALLLYLRDPDYYRRIRAFNALRELAGEGFGYNPVLEAESQPAAMAGFDKWWAETAKALREEPSPPEKQ
jgi:hypothetical protein